MTAVLQEFAGIAVGAITTIAQGIATGVTSMATGLLLETDATTGAVSLSAFGGIIAIFAGFSLGLGVCRLVYMFIVSIGGKR